MEDATDQVEDIIQCYDFLREELQCMHNELNHVKKDLDNTHTQLELTINDLRVVHGILDSTNKQLFLSNKKNAELINKLDEERLKLEHFQREAKLQHISDMKYMGNLVFQIEEMNANNAQLNACNAQLSSSHISLNSKLEEINRKLDILLNSKNNDNQYQPAP